MLVYAHAAPKLIQRKDRSNGSASNFELVAAGLLCTPSVTETWEDKQVYGVNGIRASMIWLCMLVENAGSNELQSRNTIALSNAVTTRIVCKHEYLVVATLLQRTAFRRQPQRKKHRHQATSCRFTGLSQASACVFDPSDALDAAEY